MRNVYPLRGFLDDVICNAHKLLNFNNDAIAIGC